MDFTRFQINVLSGSQYRYVRVVNNFVTFPVSYCGHCFTDMVSLNRQGIALKTANQNSPF